MKAILNLIKMKALFAFILSLVSVIARADVYEHKYYNANFPDTIPEHFEVSGTDNFHMSRYRNDSVRLKISVFPLGLNMSNPEWIGHTLGLPQANNEEFADGSLGGKHVFKETSVRCLSDSSLLYSNLYLISNGEITLMLFESRVNSPLDWWGENIELRIPDQPTRSLSERTNDVEEFFNQILHDDNTTMKITKDADHIKIDVVDPCPSEDDRGDLGAKISVYKLIKMFTVFEEYANLGYTFSVKIIDGDGNVVCDGTFTPDEYSTWCDDTFTEQPKADAITEENPDPVLEVIEVME